MRDGNPVAIGLDVPSAARTGVLMLATDVFHRASAGIETEPDARSISWRTVDVQPAVGIRRTHRVAPDKVRGATNTLPGASDAGRCGSIRWKIWAGFMFAAATLSAQAGPARPIAGVTSAC